MKYRKPAETAASGIFVFARPMRLSESKACRSSRSPWDVFRALYGKGEEICFFLDSPGGGGPERDFSYLAWDPFLEISVTLNNEGDFWFYKNKKRARRIFSGPELISILRKLFSKYRFEGKKRQGPFLKAGAAGFLGYDLAALFEPVALRKEKARPGVPVLYLAFFRRVLAYDHLQKKYRLFFYRESNRRGVKKWHGTKELQGLLSAPPLSLASQGFRFRKFRPEMGRSAFQSMVKRAKKYIEAGDIYQANLSQRFRFECEGSRLRLYDVLRKVNPSPFASFLKIRDLEILSSSPERLVLKRGRYCETKPIAGTRPRRQGRRKLQALRKELLENEKERAEHIMLVDLERNDLGRVCEWKSVRVEELMKIEAYSHVIHLVSKVTGRLRRDKNGLDLIKALFPGGTITGCPKIRCMEIIEELEPVGRGLYTGSVGYMDFCGDMDWNIVIRTLVIQGNQGSFQVGAGIVYDSDPRREYEETLHKGQALKEALIKASRQEVRKDSFKTRYFAQNGDRHSGVAGGITSSP